MSNINKRMKKFKEPDKNMSMTSSEKSARKRARKLVELAFMEKENDASSNNMPPIFSSADIYTASSTLTSTISTSMNNFTTVENVEIEVIENLNDFNNIFHNIPDIPQTTAPTATFTPPHPLKEQPLEENTDIYLPDPVVDETLTSLQIADIPLSVTFPLVAPGSPQVEENAISDESDPPLVPDSEHSYAFHNVYDIPLSTAPIATFTPPHALKERPLEENTDIYLPDPVVDETLTSLQISDIPLSVTFPLVAPGSPQVEENSISDESDPQLVPDSGHSYVFHYVSDNSQATDPTATFTPLHLEKERLLEEDTDINLQDPVVDENLTALQPADSSLSVTFPLVAPGSPQVEENPISDESGEPLVPYSEHSDSDMSASPDRPKKSKTRKKRFEVKPKNWFAQKNKAMREKGQKYYGRVKTEGKWNYEALKMPRQMKDRCKCPQTAKGSLKCSSISENDRKNIFKMFWNLTWGEKKIYIDGLVKSIPTQRARARINPDVSRRSQSLIYNLKIEDSEVKVCRTMFLNTLSVGRWTVLECKNKINKRERNSQRNNNEPQVKPFEIENQELLKFLDSLPAMESHYCRSSSKKKYLLPEWSSKQSLYNFYVKEWCKSRNIRPLSTAKFRQTLDSRNIALFRPKKDLCEKCAEFKVGRLSEEQYQIHITKKNEARDEKEKDKNEQSLVFTADLQAVLMSPKSNISSLYYRTKLQIHNLCFFNLNTKDGFCFLWNEVEGGVNAEEFATVWVNFIEHKILPQIDQNNNARKIIFYTDGCSYQNRNVVMSNALVNAAINNNITIEQKYLETGHTQMEADSMHSTVERCMKMRNVNVPADYAYICKIARKNPRPYDVNYVTHTFFKKFEKVEFYKSIRPGRAAGDSKVTDIRALKYTPQGEIFYKLRFVDEWKLIPQRKTKNIGPCLFDNLTSLHQNRRKIKARKFEDLQYIKNTLPPDYHDYYDNIPHE